MGGKSSGWMEGAGAGKVMKGTIREGGEKRRRQVGSAVESKGGEKKKGRIEENIFHTHPLL